MPGKQEKLYIAHINEKTGKPQTVREHSEGTARLCREFSIEPLKEVTYAMGMLHDIGKISAAFQNRIRGMNIKAPHAICGAIEAKEKYGGITGTLMSYCIAGHHAGIPDAGKKKDESFLGGLYNRMNFRKQDNNPEMDYSAYEQEIGLPEVNEKELFNYICSDCYGDFAKLVDKFAFLTRYCFSCLTDADSLDTAKACGNIRDKKLKADFRRCLEKVDGHLKSFVCETELQKARGRIQQQAFEKVNEDAEIFLMNMPTGSGKTLCSVKFALEKAIAEGKKRIIYVIPYNSIIDQTAGEFEKIFGEDGEILRHQSTFSYKEEKEPDKGEKGDCDKVNNDNEDYREAALLATENWDAPIIITTAVQFFESMYANKRSKLRKIHNMADSILIFDEAHLMPQEYLQPCLQAISYITKYLGSTAILLTATMPDFDNLIRRYALPESTIRNLIEDKHLFEKFHKCDYKYLGELGEENLIAMAQELPSALIIVNKKDTARSLYKMCSGRKYHLSTYMTSIERKRVIDEIKIELKELERDFPGLYDVPEDRRIIVVSTSLIEAGVDLDMSGVFRELAGLDNILQSGGRCNREGKKKDAQTFVFELSNEALRIKNETDITNATRYILKNNEQIDSHEIIAEYYEIVYGVNREKNIKNTLSKRCNDIRYIPFAEYARDFRIINETESLFVATDDKSEALLSSMERGEQVGVRSLQPYLCNITWKELEGLEKQNAVKEFGQGVFCLVNKDYYDRETGIGFEAKDYII